MQPQTNKLVKRFVAPTMRRALDLVRAEMGPEAVILSSQKVDGGVEVITSVEPDLPTRGIDVRREFGRHFDSELDTAMNSDAAWQMQSGVDQAAAQYASRVEVNDRRPAAEPRGAQIAREIEKARERMLDAKRRAREADQPLEEMRRQPRAERPSAAAEQPVQPQYDNTGAFAGGARSQAYDSAGYSSGYSSAGYASEAHPSHSHSSAAYHSSGAAQVSTPEEDARLESLQSELADMRMILEQQLWRISAQNETTAAMPSQINMPAGFSVLGDHMARLGLPEKLAQRLLRDAGHDRKVSNTWRRCMTRLAGDIPVVEGDFINQGGIFAFVGQTGVGKTTTIAKLAARYVLENGPGKVALVTTDTYRVGAYDQLRSLGRILSVPVRAVDNDNSLLTILASLRQFPLILIDTAGFRLGDPLLKDQLRKLDTCKALKRVLVLASNSQLQTLKASSHAYSSAHSRVDACVLTKLDEAASLGEAISVLLERDIPLAYTTDGQEIPRDIAPASGHKVVAAAVALLKSGGGTPGTALG